MAIHGNGLWTCTSYDLDGPLTVRLIEEIGYIRNIFMRELHNIKSNDVKQAMIYQSKLVRIAITHWIRTTKKLSQS